MTAAPPGWALLLILGILAIVAGAGVALQGYNQMQAADEWASQTHYRGTVETSQGFEMPDCPDNPYEGGETKVFLGLAVVGGVATRYGAE